LFFWHRLGSRGRQYRLRRLFADAAEETRLVCGVFALHQREEVVADALRKWQFDVFEWDKSLEHDVGDSWSFSYY
jgi:hypothetical protein